METSARFLEDTREWKQLWRNMQDGIVVLCEVGNAEWSMEDGARILYRSTTEWERTNEDFHFMLQHFQIGYIVLPKDIKGIQKRMSVVLDALDIEWDREYRGHA